MRKLTKKEKRTKIKQLNGWIGVIEDRLIAIKNIQKQALKDIEIANKDLVEEKKSRIRSIPEYIDNFKFEQYRFKDIETANNYIEKLRSLISSFQDPEIYKKYMPNVKVFTMLLPILLIKRAQLEIVAMTDYDMEISSLKNKLQKHKKSLKRLEHEESYTPSQIAKGIKKKEDHLELIQKCTKEINSKYNTLKLHIKNLYQNRKYRKQLEKFMRGESEYEIFSIGWEEYTVDTIPKDSFIPYVEKEKKRRVWIKKTISDVRILKDKLYKLQNEFDEYLIESGSVGEKIVRQWLNNNSIDVEEQKRFSDCLDKSTLPFDFFIPTLKILIEFDGAQHYMPIELFGGEDGFIDRKRKDAIKTKWAENSEYKLFRIRYDENVELALKSIFTQE